MRWLLLFALGACSFSPGRLSGDGGPEVGDGSTAIDAPSDTMLGVDAALDGNVQLAEVRSIDLVDAMVSGGPHTDFPLLVSLSTTWIRSQSNGGDVANDNGADLYFASDQAGTAVLAFDVEAYDASTGALVVWVKVPSLAASTVIYLHYGDPAITTSQQMRTATWSGGYELVLHMDGTDDATGKAGSGSSSNVAAATGRFGGGSSFDGSTSVASFGSGAAVDNIFTGGGTVEAWFFADTYGAGSRGRIIQKGDGAGWSLFLDNSNVTNSVSFLHGASSNFGAWSGPSNSVTTGAWHHVAVTYDQASTSNNPTGMIDGVAITLGEQATPSGSVSSDAAENVLVGNSVGGTRTFDGILDEIRMSSTVRSSDWTITQYRNYSDPTTFYAVSAPL